MGLSLKLAVVSTTVMSTAVMLKLLTPVITDLAVSDFPTIWTSLISWLKPPYLYVVMNCIIITIVASSRLQSKLEGPHSISTFPSPVHLPAEPVKAVLPVELPHAHHEPEVNFDGGFFVNEPVKYVHVPEPVNLVKVAVPDLSNSDKFVSDEKKDEEMEIAKKAYEEIKKNSRVNKKLVISMSTSKAKQLDLSDFSMDKPPASARFSHRKPSKSTNEGGRTLGVAKAKKQDTLETTWKTITEGRSVPLTRHLRKSDTWETHGNSRQSRNSEDFPINQHSERMTKSDTFDVNRDTGRDRKPLPPPSKLNRSGGGSGRLKKEPSLGQEELNRRVEAFIKKFNEDMRLQRQESLNQYMEMINRGAH